MRITQIHEDFCHQPNKLGVFGQHFYNGYATNRAKAQIDGDLGFVEFRDDRLEPGNPPNWTIIRVTIGDGVAECISYVTNVKEVEAALNFGEEFHYREPEGDKYVKEGAWMNFRKQT
jgi:hypothetical protein